MHKRSLALITLLVVFVATFAILSSRLTKKINSSSFTSASATLSNSRLSFKAAVASGASGSSVVTISSGGGDANTNHLFPGDVVCFTDAGQNGCIGNKTYTVDSVINPTTFNLTTTLSNALDTSGFVVATQAGNLTIGFTTVSTVPVGGSLVITVPMSDSAKGANRIPDANDTIAHGGFDIGTLGPSNIIVSAGCTPSSWGTSDMVSTIATGSAGVDHVFTWTRSGTDCTGTNAITVTIGGPGIVNPAPFYGATPAHVQGTADVYGITVTTKDAGGNILDSSVPRAAAVEAVLISGTVDETLSFVVAGMASGGTYCGYGASVSATATSIPWGHFTAANTFVYAAQQLTVNTNAASGYTVTVSEDDQMGKNGVACTGVDPSAGDYTFGSATCIRDTTCNGTCTYTTSADWTNAVSYPGLGYSLASQSGTDAPFYYYEKNRTFSAKDFSDTSGIGAAVEAPATIMSNAGPVSGSSIYVCYRITIPGNQPAGYYDSIAQYTATAVF